MSDKLSNKHQDSSSAMQGSNTLYLETLYRRYQKDNNAVHSSWKSFFDNLESSQVRLKIVILGLAGLELIGLLTKVRRVIISLMMVRLKKFQKN